MIGGEVTGQCSRNLILSLKLPSSTWVGALVLTEELKNIVLYISCGGTCALPLAALLFLDGSPLVSAFPPFLDKQLFESALWNSGKVREVE